MALTDSMLALIRDEIGPGTPPSDDELFDTFAELDHPSWIPTALRVLRRRRGELTGREVKSVSLPGGLSIGLSSNLASLDRQILRLERQLADLDPEQAAEGLATQSQITRTGYR